MKPIHVVTVLLGLGAGACATSSGQSVANMNAGFGQRGIVVSAGRAAAFDHHCPPDRIRLIRADGGTVDLDVCGQVRRYKAVAGGFSEPTWLDVTTLYPPSALPAPLAPQ